MFAVFSPIFVAGKNIVFRYIFVAPLQPTCMRISPSEKPIINMLETFTTLVQISPVDYYMLNYKLNVNKGLYANNRLNKFNLSLFILGTDSITSFFM